MQEEVACILMSNVGHVEFDKFQSTTRTLTPPALYKYSTIMFSLAARENDAHSVFLAGQGVNNAPLY